MITFQLQESVWLARVADKCDEGGVGISAGARASICLLDMYIKNARTILLPTLSRGKKKNFLSSPLICHTFCRVWRKVGPIFVSVDRRRI